MAADIVRQLGDVDGDAPCLLVAEQLGRSRKPIDHLTGFRGSR